MNRLEVEEGRSKVPLLTFHLRHRRRIASASIGTLALTLVALAVPNATASAAGSLASVIPGTTSAAATASQIPTASQPVSVWQAWASAQTKAIESVPWMQMFQEADCTLNKLAYETVPADIGELGAPAGVYMTSVGGSATCPNGTFPAFLNQPASVVGNSPSGYSSDRTTAGQACLHGRSARGRSRLGGWPRPTGGTGGAFLGRGSATSARKRTGS